MCTNTTSTKISRLQMTAGKEWERAELSCTSSFSSAKKIETPALIEKEPQFGDTDNGKLSKTKLTDCLTVA